MPTITDYTDIISVEDAKKYLRIDTDNTDSDSEIEVMIDSACNLIENYTQTYLKPRDNVYYFNNANYIRLYSYPVNEIVLPTVDTGYSIENKNLYTVYYRENSYLESMTFNIGYTDTANVKAIFKMAILETVKLWFYGSETETAMKGYIPNSVMAILSSERRFIF